jgi:hypothetical protein
LLDVATEELAVESTLKRIGDSPELCAHPQHKPPIHQYLEPGIYEHECPRCHAKVQFRVQQIVTLIPAPVVTTEHVTRMDPASNVTKGSCSCKNGCKAWDCDKL